MAAPLLSVEGAGRSYRKGQVEVHALAEVSLTFQPGELAVLHGTSGAGKSTLLYLLGGLGQPSRGRVLFDGQDLARLSPAAMAEFRRNKVGFVFQSCYLIPTLTALENVTVPMLPLRLPRHEVAARAGAALEEVGLSHRADHLPGELSGGEQQRVVIARALVMQPSVLLADEPTSDLDRQTAEQIVGLLDRLRQEQDRTVILATHDQRILGYAGRRIELEDGRVVADSSGPPVEPA